MIDDFFPMPVLTLFGIPVRDTVVSTWLLVWTLLALAALVRWRWPAVTEMLVRVLADTVTDVMGRPAWPFVPFLGTLAIFLALANTWGILPSLPLPDGRMLRFVSPTRDINTPLALALVVFLSVYWFGIRAKGAWQYFKDMASPLFLAPLILLLELFGQISRTLSLTLRLFGNIISTELIVAVVFALVPLIAPLPLVGFSMFTGLLQAYIFTSLAAVYIGTGLDSKD